MNGNYLIGLICLLLASMAGRILLERAQKKLDDETKLKLLNKFSRSRIAALIIMPILVIAYYLVYLFFPAYSKILVLTYIVFIVLLLIVSGLLGFKKLKALEVPGHYVRTFIISRVLIIIGVATFVILLFFGSDERNYFDFHDNKMNAGNYAYSAYKESSSQNYQQSLIDYNEAIKLDSSNPTYFSNRGTTKYYLHDLSGACADWKKAVEMGDTGAQINLDNFCK